MADEFTRGAEVDNADRADGGDEESLVLTQQSHAKSDGNDEDSPFGDLKSNKGRDHATYTDCHFELVRPFHAVGPFFQLDGFLCSDLWPPLGEESRDDVEDDLGAADERESHAEAEDAAGVGDELGGRRLDLPQVAAGVRVLRWITIDY